MEVAMLRFAMLAFGLAVTGLLIRVGVPPEDAMVPFLLAAAFIGVLDSAR